MLEYTVAVNEHVYRTDGESFARILKRSADHFKRHGIRSVVTAAVIMQKQDGHRGQAVALEAPSMPGHHSAAQLTRIFDAMHQSYDHPTVLAARWAWVPGVEIRRVTAVTGADPSSSWSSAWANGIEGPLAISDVAHLALEPARTGRTLHEAVQDLSSSFPRENPDQRG